MLRLRGPDVFAVPHRSLDILVSLNKCAAFIQDFFPSAFIPIRLLQELIDTWAQQAAMDQSPPAATVSPNLTKRSSDWRLDLVFFNFAPSRSVWTNKLISLKASLTDRAAADQKASLTFQSVTGQIRQQRAFRAGIHLSDAAAGL